MKVHAPVLHLWTTGGFLHNEQRWTLQRTAAVPEHLHCPPHPRPVRVRLCVGPPPLRPPSAGSCSTMRLCGAFVGLSQSLSQSWGGRPEVTGAGRGRGGGGMFSGRFWLKPRSSSVPGPHWTRSDTSGAPFWRKTRFTFRVSARF